MNAKPLGAILAALAAGLLGLWYEAPAIAWHRLQAAADGGDAAAFDELVDYPRVRDRLQHEFSARLAAARGSPDGGGSGIGAAAAALGAAVGTALATPLLDAAVRPDTVRRLVRDGRIAPRWDDLLGPASRAASGAPAAEPARWQTHHEGLDRYVAQARADGPDAGAPTLSLVLERRGGLSWRLTEIRVPALRR